MTDPHGDDGTDPRGKSAGDVLALLLAVADLDTTIAQLAHRRGALAESSGLHSVETQLAALAADHADAAGRRGALRDTQQELETRIAALAERRDAVQRRMYAATGSSARDLQAMSDEVRHLTERQAELEELELSAMLEQDPVDAELADLDGRMGPLQAQATDLRRTVAHEEQTLGAELAVAEGDRAEKAAALPTALAGRYEALRARLRGSGAARLVGNRCDGCHLELSSVEVERIRALPPDEVATCEQCGRLLVPV